MSVPNSTGGEPLTYLDLVVPPWSNQPWLSRGHGPVAHSARDRLVCPGAVQVPLRAVMTYGSIASPECGEFTRHPSGSRTAVTEGYTLVHYRTVLGVRCPNGPK